MAVRRFSSCLGTLYSRTCLSITRRGYCTNKPSDEDTVKTDQPSDTAKTKKPKIPLSQPFPGAPTSSYGVSKSSKSETRRTVLKNGLTVASENNYGSFMTIGILIDSGSRYEVKHPSGISHFLEKLAFGTTDKFSNKDHVLQNLEEVGGICDSQGSRDTLIYAMSVSAEEGVEKAVEVLSETVLRPTFTDTEMEETKTAIKFELQGLHDIPEPEILMSELYHQAAYKDNTLGLPRYATEEGADSMTAKHLLSYLKCYHTPERMVLAGSGVDHDSLVQLAEKHFISKTPVWEEHSDLIDVHEGFDNSISQYTGGIVTLSKDMTKYSIGQSPMPNLVHGVVGLKSVSHKDEHNFIPTCVLHSLLGGGGSFSAGGPGKGMYTRLYINVLNRCDWMYNATAQSHAYNDSGTLCIHVSAEPQQTKPMFEILIKEFLSLKNHKVGDVELSRAKAQLKSQLLMNLESRPVMFEDVGRQILAIKVRRSAEYYMNKIDAVSADDIQRVAQDMLKSPPSIAVIGDLTQCPTYADFETAFFVKNGSFPWRAKLFK